MSWWIYLEDDNGAVTVDNHAEGGTYIVGGTNNAHINVTYNYSRYFYFEGLHGRKAADTIQELEQAVAELGVERDTDYWARTPGNAGHTINILLNWARQHPDATWDVN